LRDLFEHSDEVTVADVELLKVGRHMRMNGSTKIIIGRREQENAELAAHATGGDAVLEVIGYPGPVALVRGNVTDEMIEKAAAFCVRYSDAPGDREAPVKVLFEGREFTVSANSARQDEIKALLI
jgi:predicted ribosome quality control (RQC) complex YloA/Tae2 family protein